MQFFADLQLLNSQPEVCNYSSRKIWMTTENGQTHRRLKWKTDPKTQAGMKTFFFKNNPKNNSQKLKMKNVKK